MDERNEHVRRLRDRFEREAAARIDDIVFNGDRDCRLPHLANISFRFIEGEGLLIHLDMQGVAVSTGSACSSGNFGTITGDSRVGSRRRAGARRDSI
jgi:cysteine desulfurase